MSVYRRLVTPRLALLMLTVLASRTSFAQIATGTITGNLRDLEGVPIQTAITISSELGFRTEVDTDAHGTFLLALPYGRYELTTRDKRFSRSPPVSVAAEPLQTHEIRLLVTPSG